MRLSDPFGALFCTLGGITPSFFICLLLARLYYKYRGFSILSLALFSGSLSDGISLTELRWIEGSLFLVCLLLLRKFKLSAVSVILGSGVVGTVLYLLSEAIFPA